MLAPLTTRGFFMQLFPMLDEGQTLDLRTAAGAPAVRAAFIWMQNNSPAQVLQPTSDDVATSTTRYDWPLHNANSAENYARCVRRYRDTTYSGTAGEGTANANLIDATTSDLNVVQLYDGSGTLSATSKVTSIPGNGRFKTGASGTATITYRFKHPTDANTVLTSILTVTIN